MCQITLKKIVFNAMLTEASSSPVLNVRVLRIFDTQLAKEISVWGH